MEKKIVIMGRAGTGKSMLARRLAEISGTAVLKTCTTRPRRTPEENSYHFHTAGSAAEIPASEKLFYTESVDGFARWTNRADFLSAGIAILDPTGMPGAIAEWKKAGCAVAVVYVKADDGARRSAWAGDPDKFMDRERHESPMFREFEQEALPRLCGAAYGADKCIVWQNDFTEEGMDAFAGRILEWMGKPGRTKGFAVRFNGVHGAAALPDGTEYFLHRDEVRDNPRKLRKASAKTPVPVEFLPGPAPEPGKRPRAFAVRITGTAGWRPDHRQAGFWLRDPFCPEGAWRCSSCGLTQEEKTDACRHCGVPMTAEPYKQN